MSTTYHISLFEHIHKVEKEHFWFVARNEIIRGLLKRFLSDLPHTTFLDIGCGTGFVMGEVEKLGLRVTGLDVNARALQYAKKVTKGTLVRSSIFSFHPKKPFDAAGAFDVMEHIPNDKGFLVRCNTVLKPGGFLFLTVPAGQYLWSSVDEISGHQRRYSKERLEQILTQTGFRISSMGYWNSVLVPVYTLWRLISGDTIQRYLKKPNYGINSLLLFLLRLEGIGHFPFGATLMVVAQKV